MASSRVTNAVWKLKKETENVNIKNLMPKINCQLVQMAFSWGFYLKWRQLNKQFDGLGVDFLTLTDLLATTRQTSQLITCRNTKEYDNLMPANLI